jgi:enoyl-CoA hydratase/carnithine racemase
MQFEHIELHVGDTFARLTLNRPDRRNALSLPLMREMLAALDEVEDGKAPVLVIEGRGPAFSAGHDLGEIVATRETEFYEALFSTCVELMTRLHTIPQPAIAKVHGVATAAGCQLVAACDLAIASDDARFATPGVNIGLFCSTPMVALSRAVGRKAAMEMLLTGELISADDAARIGLVNHVVADGRERAEALKLADKIAAKSTLTVKIGKEAFYRQAEMTLADAYDYASAVMVENMLARDAEEGISAFIEKRDATWQDR